MLLAIITGAVCLAAGIIYGVHYGHKLGREELKEELRGKRLLAAF